MGVALLALLLAMLLWGLAPASECGTPHEIRWWAGLLPFLVFLVIGIRIVGQGDPGRQMTLFLASAAVVATYTLVLSLSLPMVIATEISCAAQRQS